MAIEGIVVTIDKNFLLFIASDCWLNFNKVIITIINSCLILYGFQLGSLTPYSWEEAEGKEEIDTYGFQSGNL